MTRELSVVILISAGRSGSKYVRDLLGASRHCAVVPFDINFVWRHGNETESSDVLDPAMLDPRKRDWIRKQVLRLASGRDSAPGRIVVEKSVPNSLRVPFVRAVFPEAKLVHLIRDGRAVAESARRVWNDRPSWSYSLGKLQYMHMGGIPYLFQYAVNQMRSGDRMRSARSWGPRYRGMEEDLRCLPLLQVCGRQWLECITRAESGLDDAPSDKVFRVRLEDLVLGRESLQELCAFAGIPDSQAVEEAWQSRSDRSVIDKWRQQLTMDETAMLTGLMRRELERFGYPT